MISDGVNCFSAVPAVSQCAPSGCNRISLLLSELLSSLLGAQRDRAIAINVEDCRGNAKCMDFLMRDDCARKGIWFVLLEDRHVYLTVQTYIHSYIGSYIHKQFVLIAF